MTTPWAANHAWARSRNPAAVSRARDDLQQAKATVTTGYAGEPDLLGQMVSNVEIAQSVLAEMEVKAKKPPRTGS